MRDFILKRAASGVALIVLVPTVTFFLLYRDPTSIARNILGEGASTEQVNAKVAQLGLDRPPVEQFFSWAASALHGNLGTSWFTSTPVSTSLSVRVPVTLWIVLLGVLLTALVAIALGVAAAVRGGWMDRALQVVSVGGFSIPNFWLGLMLVLVFAINLRVLPATGYVAPSTSVSRWAASLVLPVLAIAIHAVAAATQQVRGATKDVLEQDYIRTLRARGLSGRSIVFRHALKNAAPPALTVLSLQLIGLLSGAVVIEKVFAIPGLGSLTVNATSIGDIPVVMGVVLVTVFIVVIANLLIDLAYGWVNPKVRVQ